MFGAQGFARTRTEDVAEQAGYGQATVFFHFRTKVGLLEACLQAALEKARASMVPAEASDTLDLVRRLDRAFDNPQTAAFLSRMLTEFGESSAIRPALCRLPSSGPPAAGRGDRPGRQCLRGPGL